MISDVEKGSRSDESLRGEKKQKSASHSLLLPMSRLTAFHRSGSGASQLNGHLPVKRTSRSSRMTHASGVPTSLSSPLVNASIEGSGGYSLGNGAGEYLDPSPSMRARVGG